MRFIEKVHQEKSLKALFNSNPKISILPRHKNLNAQTVKGTLISRILFKDKRHLNSLGGGCKIAVGNEIFKANKDALFIKWGSRLYSTEVLSYLKSENSTEPLLNVLFNIGNTANTLNKVISKTNTNLCLITKHIANV